MSFPNGQRVYVAGHGPGIVITNMMNTCQVLLDGHDRGLWFPPRELAPHDGPIGEVLPTGVDA